MNEPIQLKYNQFWGRRSGCYVTAKPKNIDRPWGFVFKIKRGSMKSSDNRGPCGHKMRWYFARAMSQNKRPLRNYEHRMVIK